MPAPRFSDPLLSIVNAEIQETIQANGLESLGGMSEPKVNVLMFYDGDISDLKNQGISIGAMTGQVATARCHLSNLQTISQHPAVRHVEFSQIMRHELDRSGAAIRSDIAHANGFTGKGVIIGIIDSSLDYTHPDFLDNNGRSRILAIWDQKLSPQDGERSPASFSFGVEYTNEDIEQALAGGRPLRHNQPTTLFQEEIRPSAHGTHVTSIAAGAGRSDPQFVGVAPEASIIFVSNRLTTASQVDSTSTLNGVQYIAQLAKARGLPVVINLSQGTQIASHDGKSLLEIGLDNLLGEPGVALVKSAGNSGTAPIHAQARIAPRTTEDIQLLLSDSNQSEPIILTIWYPGSASLDVAVSIPSGEQTPFVLPNDIFPGAETTSTNLQNLLRIVSSQQLPVNGMKNIVVYFRINNSIANLGMYTIHLQGSESNASDVDVHLWVEGGNASFQPPHVDLSYTISVPGTGQEVINVGSFVTRTGHDSLPGGLSSFSSHGPTLDGRPKPELTAPGERIVAGRNRQSLAAPYDSSPQANDYTATAGTSMAAPHVTGTIALMLEKNAHLTATEIKQILMKSTTKDEASTANPDPNTWGAGKLDVQAALDNTPSPTP